MKLLSLDKKFYFICISVILFLVLVFQYILISKGFYSISADESGHIWEAFCWYRGKGSIFSIWLPFQKILYGLSFHLYFDLFLIPRILSSLFGIMTVYFIIKLAYELFQNQIIAVLTGFLAAIFYPTVIFSVLPLTEIYFFFFTISSLAFYFQWRNDQRNRSLWLSIILMSLNTTTRYEAWFFALSLGLMLYYQLNTSRIKSKYIHLFLAVLVLAGFPIFWIYLSKIETNELSGFIRSVSSRYTAGDYFSELKNNVIPDFLSMNINSLNIIGFISLCFGYKKFAKVKEYVFLFAFTLLLFAVMTFLSKAMPTNNAWRLASIWSLLLLPFTANWLNDLLINESISPMNKLNFGAFIFLLVLFFTTQTIQYSNSSYTTDEDLKVGKIIQELLDLNKMDMVYIEPNGLKYSNITIASQSPDRFSTESIFKYKNDSLIIDMNTLANLKNKNIKYALFNPKTKIKIMSMEITELKKFNQWIVYKIL